MIVRIYLVKNSLAKAPRANRPSRIMLPGWVICDNIHPCNHRQCFLFVKFHSVYFYGALRAPVVNFYLSRTLSIFGVFRQFYFFRFVFLFIFSKLFFIFRKKDRKDGFWDPRVHNSHYVVTLKNTALVRLLGRLFGSLLGVLLLFLLVLGRADLELVCAVEHF